MIYLASFCWEIFKTRPPGNMKHAQRKKSGKWNPEEAVDIGDKEVLSVTREDAAEDATKDLAGKKLQMMIQSSLSAFVCNGGL